MLKKLIAFFTLFTLFMSISLADSCSTFECSENQKVETCTLCNYCTNVNLSFVSTNIKPVYKQISSFSPISHSNLLENKIPNLLFRPPIS